MNLEQKSSRPWPISNCLNLLGINGNAFSAHHMPQKRNALQSEFTLGELVIQLMPPQSLQHNPQVSGMIILRSRIYQNIVDEANGG
ncbi:hypothetical protein KFK09_002928 [Dendrobium nobile]|uniref:Uncharacterized protein n=1 Tax=Dendrobium nobile TaxID=94219 RepID=A0A8T3C515_DENNO|nr:hypothetical protein KFK09_002928 [Dendrobium nobile]